MDFLPSESDINKRIVELCKAAPAYLQKIGEVFLSIRNPKRYEMLRPQGRNAWLQTKKGYPDAYARDAHGLHIVEATVGDWRTHIEKEDLKAIPKVGNVGSYVLFILHASESLIPQINAAKDKLERNEEYFKDKLAALGIARDQIEFIFLDQLVQALRRPQYAWLLRDLDLAGNIAPFEPLDVITFSVPDGPNVPDFISESVICRSRLDALFKTINACHIVVLNGLGGAGKTTTGVALAYKWANHNAAGAYYLDAKSFSGALGGTLRSALSVIEVYKETRTLFVIDNVHLLQTDEIARIVHYVASPPQSTILLLGRGFPKEVFQKLDLVTRRRIHIETISVEPNDLLAAYTLYVKHTTGGMYVPPPSTTQLSEWHRLAPDLVLFCASLRASRAAFLGGLVPEVSRQLAVDYVKNQYVLNLPASEREALVIIAKLATLEIPASLRSVGGKEPSWLLDNELVTQLNVSNNQTLRFSLPHDNFGLLILDCFDCAAVNVAWTKAISSDIFQASYVARRLIDLGNHAVAIEILSAHEADIWTFTDLFPPGFAHTLDTLYERVGLIGVYRSRLQEIYEKFVGTAVNILAGANSYISFAERHGCSVDTLHQILFNQPSEKMEIALKLAAPIDFAYFVKVVAKNGGAASSFHNLLLEQNVLRAFINKFRSVSLSDINAALGIIHLHDRLIESRLGEQIRLNDAVLKNFTDSIVFGVVGLHDFLKYQHIVEMFSVGNFGATLADRLSKSMAKITSLMDRYPDAGPNTRGLIDNALRLASTNNAVRKTDKKSANILYYVIMGALVGDTVQLYIKGLKHEELMSLTLNWPIGRARRVFEAMRSRFSDTEILNSIGAAMRDSTWFKVENSLLAHRYVALAIHRYAWKILGGDRGRLSEKVDPALHENLSFLNKKLIECEAYNFPDQDILNALKDGISDVSRV